VSNGSAVDIDALIALQAQSFAGAGPGLRGSWPLEQAMDGPELGAFLSAHRYCVLATTTLKGRPLARPVAFTALAAAIWLATVDGPRLRSLRRTPWASLVVAEGDAGEHRAVTFDGAVTLHSAAPDAVAAAWRERHGNDAAWAEAWVELEPARVLSYAARGAAGG
jgi:nitroimidazol reductase NimA-like FMN-containing flavoprotein (pyridoxamine 5'-phosphate oxidase superfamily)